MTFAIRNLAVLNYAQGYTSWHYRGHETTRGASLTPPCTIAEACAPGFFDPAKDMIARGDTIVASCADGGVWLYVDSVAGGVKVRVMARREGE